MMIDFSNIMDFSTFKNVKPTPCRNQRLPLLCVLFLIYGSISLANTDRTLYFSLPRLCEEADIIVLAEIRSVNREFPKHDFPTPDHDLNITIHCEKVLKGDIEYGENLNVITYEYGSYLEHWIILLIPGLHYTHTNIPDKGMVDLFRKDDTAMFFLHRSEVDDVDMFVMYRPAWWTTNSRLLSTSEFALTYSKIEDLIEIQNKKDDSKTTINSYIEWMTKCLEDPLTRPTLGWNLRRKMDALHDPNFIDDFHYSIKKRKNHELLNEEQRKRLISSFYRIEVLSNSDLFLTYLVTQWEGEKANIFLCKKLQEYDNKGAGGDYAILFMENIQKNVKSKEELLLIEEYISTTSKKKRNKVLDQLIKEIER